MKPSNSYHETPFPLMGINNSKGSSVNINELDISVMRENDKNLCIDKVQLPHGCTVTTQQSVNIRPDIFSGKQDQHKNNKKGNMAQTESYVTALYTKI